METRTKVILGISVTAVVTVAAVIAYRESVPPPFSIEKADLLKKQGVFKFGKTVNNFSLTSGIGVAGRNGWGMAVSSKDGKHVQFDLHKRGKFVKTVKLI